MLGIVALCMSGGAEGLKIGPRLTPEGPVRILSNVFLNVSVLVCFLRGRVYTSSARGG